MNDFLAGLLAIVGGAFTLAIVSVVISKNAQTPQVIQTAASGLSSVIQAATNPVTMNNPGSGASTFSTAINSGLSSALQSGISGLI